jgi:hypothetical protein
MDTAGDNVYTEWDGVKQLAEDIVGDWFPETWEGWRARTCP